MRRDRVLAIARRDLTLVLRSRAVTLPLVGLPVIIFGVLPAVVTVAIQVGGAALDLSEFLVLMPVAVRDEVAGLPPVQQALIWLLEYQFAPIALIVPLFVASVIAADSFAGEKERRTVEALVHTPTTDRELYAGKLLAPLVAATTVGVGGFLLYVIVVNVIVGGSVGRLLLVTPTWLLLVGWVTPGVAALGLGAMVHVSARVRTFQDAYQLGGLVVLPLVLLMVGQIGGLIFFGTALVAVLGLLVWALALLLLWVGVRRWRREALITQL